MTHDHFKGKDALSHLAERLAEGSLTSKEIHGLEVPGHLHAACDAARDAAVALLLLFAILTHFDLSISILAQILGLFLLGYTIWKTGRSAWLGWSRLERLHRVMKQERWEIQHNRPQEREELEVLYGAKGFEGKLLEDVVDVLMADEDRLLRVMIEEEMGLSLENTEHPLKQGIGALIGTLVAGLFCIPALFISSTWGLPLAALVVVGASSWLTAIKADNRAIHAVVWSVGLGVLAWGMTAFIGDLFLA